MTPLETAEKFHVRVAAATEDEGRLPVAIEEMPSVGRCHVGRRLVERVGGEGPAWEA